MQQYLQVLLFMRQLNKGKIIKGGIIVQKKKVLIITIILLVITLVAGGLVIYLCTDLFKSDKQLFYKYLLDKNEMLSVLDEIEFKQDLKSYTAKTNVESIYEYDNEIEKYENDQIMKNLQENVKSFEYIKNLNANIESKVDKENEKQYHEIHIKNNDDEITKIEAVRNEDKYAVKVEDILKAYIGIENNNVKELASKFEIKDADKIPDKIDYENKMYKDLFKISKEEKEHIKSVYKDVLYKEIDKANYTKEKNCKIVIEGDNYYTNKMTLTLNKEQSIEAEIKVLEKLKEDSITLNLIANKIKTINQNSEYASVNKLNEEIQKYIENLQKEEKNNDEYIKVEIYEYNGKTIRLDLYIKEEKKLQLEYIDKNGTKKLNINQLFTKNESGAIIYDIKTSLLGANDISITKNGDNIKIDVQLYDVKEIYKNILDETKDNYSKQNENESNNITKSDIEEIQKIYDQYDQVNSKLMKIGISFEIQKQSDNNEQILVYGNICGSKLGVKLNVEKNFTDDLGEIPTIDDKNCVIMNKYSKEKIEGIAKLLTTKTLNLIKQKIK